jgi:hypothetical protein
MTQAGTLSAAGYSVNHATVSSAFSPASLECVEALGALPQRASTLEPQLRQLLLQLVRACSSAIQIVSVAYRKSTPQTISDQYSSRSATV